MKKDPHPEPRYQIIKIFLWGILITPLAAIAELFLLWLTKPFGPQAAADALSQGVSFLNQYTSGWRALVGLVFFAPMVEEYLKYRVIKDKIGKNSNFDEPPDAMIYLITGGLGFAAAENLLVVFQSPLLPFSAALSTISLRFVGATFLHALASGIVGYFWAKSLFETKKKPLLIVQGLTLAIVFHGSYNYLVSMKNSFPSMTLLIIPTLIIVATFISFGFQNLKKKLSICKI
ncbi:MAG: PrsW family intramembrane metalloprotease [Candidatus Portnoybacteria bacterium]|nr:PrsW family intramembrane metalloprotease [Candidatus Portnoybacteria bacterium]